MTTTDIRSNPKFQYSNSQNKNNRRWMKPKDPIFKFTNQKPKNEQTSSSVFHHHLCLFVCLKKNWGISLKRTWKGWEQWDCGTVKEDHAAGGLPMGCLRVLHVMSTGPALASVRSSEAGSTMAEHTQYTSQFITVAEHTYNAHTVSVYCFLIIITTHISLLLPYNTHVTLLLPYNSTHDNPTTTDASVYCFPKQDTHISLLLPYNKLANRCKQKKFSCTHKISPSSEQTSKFNPSKGTKTQTKQQLNFTRNCITLKKRKTEDTKHCTNMKLKAALKTQ